jgi:hypothetical protein
MTTAMLVGLISTVACLVLVWPAMRRAGPTALPALLFWAAAIGAVTLLVLLAEQWGIDPRAPSRLPLPEPPQRGGVAA